METEIRNLRNEDLPKAAEIFRVAFNSVGEMWNTKTCLERIKQYFNTEACWVAEINSEMVGILIGKLDNVTDHQELYMDVLAVHPKYQKLGVGSQLMQRAEKYAKAQGYKAIWLVASTEIPSFEWYMKTGFKDTPWKAIVKSLDV